MFGTAKFGTTRYNIAATLNQIPLHAVFTDMLYGRMGVGVEYHVDSLHFPAALSAEALGAAGIPAAYTLREDVSAQGSCWLASPIEILFSDALALSAEAQADYAFSALLEETLDTHAAAEAKICFAAALSEALLAQSRVGARLQLAGIFSELLTAQPDASALEEQLVLLAVTVPPGGELRIDSENYTVTLNGENVLHLHEGDWILLDRDAYSITVDSGTGSKLTGELIFSPRYL